MSGSPSIHWQTSSANGAVATGHLQAGSATQLDDLLESLTSKKSGGPGSILHRDFAGIDDGLVVRLTNESALIMPHGGRRIIAQLDEWMRAHGCIHATPQDSWHEYPEARSGVEACALKAIALGASPRAIPLLLAQQSRFARAGNAPASTPDERARQARLAHLLRPARIVAIGAANVGKSSLLNAIAGRTVALAMDFEGTTRDSIAARVELDGVIVDWFDTPGIRESNDSIEMAAQAMAQRIIDGADLVIEVTAPGVACPPRNGPPLRIRVCTRIDLDPNRESPQARAAHACVSATQGTGLAQLAIAARNALVSDEDIASNEPWLFDDALR